MSKKNVSSENWMTPSNSVKVGLNGESHLSGLSIKSPKTSIEIAEDENKKLNYLLHLFLPNAILIIGLALIICNFSMSYLVEMDNFLFSVSDYLIKTMLDISGGFNNIPPEGPLSG